VKEARLIAYRLRTVYTCQLDQRESAHSWQIDCAIDDLAISGAGFRSEKGILQPVLEEMDRKLTGAHLQIVMRQDGRITNIDLEGVKTHNRRESRMVEAMRIILSRSVAGFDLQLPRKGAAPDGVWGQYEGILLMAPTDHGSQGASEIAHVVRQVRGDKAIIESAGKAMIVPPEQDQARNFFDTKLDSVAVFDTANGMLSERVWSARGTPTASSALATGGRGIEYLQAGKIRYLPPDAARPDLGPTQEINLPKDETDSSILQWNPLGGKPR